MRGALGRTRAMVACLRCLSCLRRCPLERLAPPRCHRRAAPSLQSRLALVDLPLWIWIYGTFAMFPDLGYIKWFNTLPGRVRWVGCAPKPLETCLVRTGAGAGSPETVMRFHSNRRHHESSQARLDQAHAPPTTPRRTKATSPMTLRLRRGGKEVEKGVGRPQVAGGKSSRATQKGVNRLGLGGNADQIVLLAKI